MTKGKVLKTRLAALAVVLFFVFAALPAAVQPSALADVAAAEYIFEGKQADAAGYAQGRVVINAAGNEDAGYFVLYWANDEGVLPDYEAIGSVEVNPGGSSVFEMVKNMAIPEGATRLAVFTSDSASVENTDIASAFCITIPPEKRLAQKTPEFTFASVSDVHVNYNSGNPNSDNFCGAPEKWTAALNYFARRGLEMVLISGDCTSEGGTSEYELYKSCIEASDFDADRIYMARGNHDSQRNDNFIRFTAHKDMVRPTEDSPWFYVLKEGKNGAKDNLFICLAQELDSISNTPNQDNFSDEQLDWLEKTLNRFAGSDVNIFIAEHAFYHNWGPGDRYDGVYVQPMHLKDAFSGNLRLQRLLMEYKEAVFMTGHSHIAFSEMVNFSDENGTACRMIHNSSTSQPRTYTAAGTISYRSEGRVTKTRGSEGYVVKVYSDNIVYSGTNLTDEKHIPTACYIMPSYSEDRSLAVSVEITKQPDLTVYSAGEFFNPAGLEVTATYKDGSKAVVNGWGLESNTTLTEETTEVGITYGSHRLSVPIRIKSINDVFKGSGTWDDPYLISTAEDFMNFTNNFRSAVGNDSNDADVYGKGRYFVQTADIDMTGYEGYAGIDARGDRKYGFSGVYNGNGHSITVSIDRPNDSDVSIFPYLNGSIINLRLYGGITASENAQPIRTIGKSGSVINCLCEMTLRSSSPNGLSRSCYGKVIRYCSRGTLAGGDPSVFCHTDTDCEYADCLHYALNSDLVALDSPRGQKQGDISAAAEFFNDHRRAAVKSAVEILRGYFEGFSEDAICLWAVEADRLTMNEVHRFGKWFNSDDGICTRKCVLCDSTETKEHGWDEGTVTDQPTAAKKGEKTFTCIDCGGKKTEQIDKLAPKIISVKQIDGIPIIQSDAALEDLVSVIIDGKEINVGTDCTVSEPGITVTLSREFAKQLSADEKHTIVIRSESGDAKAEFEVEAVTDNSEPESRVDSDTDSSQPESKGDADGDNSKPAPAYVSSEISPTQGSGADTVFSAPRYDAGSPKTGSHGVLAVIILFVSAGAALLFLTKIKHDK